MIKEITEKLTALKDLQAQEMQLAMEEIMSGGVATQDLVSFLRALSKKGETIDEITAAVSIMRRFATKINVNQQTILDTCGTGGDKKGTFNISTAVAFVAAGCGITVAKHGNRSVSSSCGSADVLEKLGVNISMPVDSLHQCLNNIGIAFIFAPNMHPAMKYAAEARKQIAEKTIFNILGPLSNPASATHQLIGVYGAAWTEKLAYVLGNLGIKHALVVHGDDGLDEITTTADTQISELRQGNVNTYKINPQDFGIPKAETDDLVAGEASINARIMLDILKGEQGPKRDIVVLNAAAAIYTADKVNAMSDGIKVAEDAIDSGKALSKLEALIKYSKR